MAYSTASTLINRCLDNLAKGGTVTTRSGSTLSDLAMGWLNSAMVHMSRKHDFSDLKKEYTSATVANQKNYTKPTDCKHVRDLVLLDGSSSIKLVPVTVREFDKLIPYPENNTTGRPNWYVEHGDCIDLYRIPDAVYTMHMKTVQWPTTITATTDSLTYKTDKDDIIVSYMCAEGFKHFQMYEDAKWWEADFMIKFKEAMINDEFMPDWNPVGRGFDSGESTIGIGDPWNNPWVIRYR